MPKNKEFISIAIQDSAVKVAYVKANGILQKASIQKAKSASQEDLLKALKTALNGYNYKKLSVVCVIPSNAATTKNIEVPSTDQQEIRSIISLQAGRHTPLSRDEVLVGYSTIGTYKANFTKVLLVIVNRSVVNEKVALLEKAGMDVDQVTFVPEAVARLYAKAIPPRKTMAPTGLIDIGANSTNFIVESRGTAAACRNIPVGTRQLTMEGQKAVSKLVEELKASLETYQEEQIDKAPDVFYVTTDHASVNDVLPALKDALGQDVQVRSYFDVVKVNTGLKKKLLKDFGEESALDVIAASSVGSRCEINLIPEEIQLKRSVQEQGKDATVTAVLTLVLLLSIAAVLLTKIYYKDAYLNQNLRGGFAGQSAEVERLEDTMVKTRIIRQHLSSRLVSLQALEAIYKIVPDQIYLSSIDMDGNGNFSIQGISDSRSKVYSFATALEESPSFKAADTKSNTTKKDRGKDVAAFEIVFQMENSEDAAPPSDL